jgi:hypothetical protein
MANETNATARAHPRRCHSYHLQTMVPRYVLNELVRTENETNVYRTRVAARVLRDWAEQQGVPAERQRQAFSRPQQQAGNSSVSSA